MTQGKNAMKCNIQKRKELGKEVEFIPDFGFCQVCNIHPSY